MRSRLISVFAIVLSFSLLIGLGSTAPGAQAQNGTPPATRAAGGQPAPLASALLVTLHDGVPTGLDKDKYTSAFGVALLSMNADGTKNLDVELAGLVPKGLYSAWWINTKPSVSRGLLGKAPADSFTADEHGNGSTTFTLAPSAEYQLLTIVYEADGKMHGEDAPGTMGSTVYTQLIGDFPGSIAPQTASATMQAMATQSAIMSSMGVAKATTLTAVTFNGIPKAADKTMWTKQIGVATMSHGTNGTDSVVLRLGRLVPNSLYTAWWINATPKRATGILSKAPGDPIKPNADGMATLSFEVPSDNNYQRLGVFFQADGNMPGTDTPGTMGSVAYIALVGLFPGPAGIALPPTRPATPSATMAATPAG